MSALKYHELGKKFAEGFKLRAENFAVKSPEIVAIVGANGSGKSTLFEILTGNLDADSGQVTLDDQIVSPSNVTVKRRMGYLPQLMHLPRWSTPSELLFYAATLYGLSDRTQAIAKAMEYWDCADFARKTIASCSFGMRKRVGLAIATLHDPDCLILDEPFSGLDLLHIENLAECIEARGQRAKLTLVSTHLLSLIAELSQRVLLIKTGLVAELKGWKQIPSTDKIATIKAELGIASR